MTTRLIRPAGAPARYESKLAKCRGHEIAGIDPRPPPRTNARSALITLPCAKCDHRDRERRSTELGHEKSRSNEEVNEAKRVLDSQCVSKTGNRKPMALANIVPVTMPPSLPQNEGSINGER